jgi:ribonuclease HI
VASKPCPITNQPSKCLLQHHKVTIVADIMHISARLRNNPRDSPHTETANCNCRDCTNNCHIGCQNPHKYTIEALYCIHSIFPKLNPIHLGDPHDNLSLTRLRKTENEVARKTNSTILFEPSITCKQDLVECFHIFTNPEKLTNRPAQRYYTPGVTLHAWEVTVFTDGACFNNRKLNARCGSGVWFGSDHHTNMALKVPGIHQSNQIGEVVAILKAASTIPKSIPLKVMTDSMYAINGLMEHLGKWKDKGWIRVKNAPLFKKVAHILKQCIATTSFQWIKGHDRVQRNEESDRLAKEGASKLNPDKLNLNIPKEFDLQGTKLATLT